MVHESTPGEVFTLGASCWPAANHRGMTAWSCHPRRAKPAKLPFWRGEKVPGARSSSGAHSVAFTREIAALPWKPRRAKRLQPARTSLRRDRCATTCSSYLREQVRGYRRMPDRSRGETLPERFRDELGDHRVCILSPLGARVHAPWAFAITYFEAKAAPVATTRATLVEATYNDDGIVAALRRQRRSARRISLTSLSCSNRNWSKT